VKTQEITDFFDTTKAACIGLNIEIFYPNLKPRHRKVPTTQTAKQICSQCEVAKGCLEYSLHFEPLGVWGGKNEVEREVLRQHRNIFLPADRQASHSVQRSVSAGRVGRIVNRLDSLNE
jgi:hypothetical protein